MSKIQKIHLKIKNNQIHFLNFKKQNGNFGHVKKGLVC
jgi:hypothetical protein